jgi:FlaA1/EpsC-like NDP-sugar epimerase
VISDEKIWKHLTQEQIEAVIAEGTYPVGDIEQMIHTAFTDNPLERITSRTIRFPLEGIANVIEGKTVLVTGGGGMIGSSLINELVTLDPAAIVVADFDENSVDQLQLELKNRGFKGKLITPLINLQNSADTEQLFVRYRPQVVFHLAAYKNTQMMEAYPEEGFLNNVAITLNVVQAASRSPGMERFVFASSVRADEPVGVYDKTKAAGEVIVRSLLAQAPFRYALVRFANIYENSPVRAEFTASAERGQPIMIANPNGKRFFMRSDEAAKLLLSAALHGEKGEVFLADMGAPVNILDLARSIIRKVTKREPVEGVTYQVGTPRTHERLMDERLFDPGSVDARRLADVYMLRTSSETPDPAWLVSEINNLTESLRQGESAAIKVLAVLDGILLESGIRLGILPNPRAGGLNPCIREIEEAS